MVPSLVCQQTHSRYIPPGVTEWVHAELMNENYFCSEKADGVRVLLFSHVQKDTGKPEIFLACTSLPPPINSHQIDRKNEYYYLPEWTLPTPDLKGFLDNTLLDAGLLLLVHTDGIYRTGYR